MKVAIIGRNGLIGKELYSRFPNAFNYLHKDLDYVFWFNAPSSQFLFNKAPEYCTNQTVSSFSNVLEFCTENNIKLIYPSSATVYAMNNDYGRCKAMLEDIHYNHGYKNVLGLRIFAGYGCEAHKGEYASIVYQFCKHMKEGQRPIIWGDGEQTRDFVHVEDVVDMIIENIDETGIIDIGSGINTSFNEVVNLINNELETDLAPIYIDAPTDYLEATPCHNPGAVKVSLREGVKKILKRL